MKLADLLIHHDPEAALPFADDSELAAALNADFTKFWGGIIAGMDRADAEAINEAMAQKASGPHTLH